MSFFKKKFGIQKHKKIHMVIDEQFIKAVENQGWLDVQKIIEPLWWSVSIYDGEEKYESDLKQFTKPQRYVFAIQWYSGEVINGGHCQFYDNSTGIVWEDALIGFETIEAYRNVDIVKESANRIGGAPSKDREQRQKQMKNYDAEFNDLDKLYYESESDMIKLLNNYVLENVNDFFFSGEITVPYQS